MESKVLKILFGERGLELCSKIFRLHSRFPILFPQTSAEQTIRFLLHLPESFLHTRKNSFIFHLLNSQHKMTKQFDKSSSSQAQLFTKILDTRRSTYGLIIAVSTLNKYESFSKEHIVQGLEHLLSGIAIVENSFVNFTYDQIYFFYLEIKKIRGGSFSTAEIKKLNDSLNEILKEKIECSLKPFVLPEIEENLFKQIKQLSNELTRADDIPQVMISFSEYAELKLTFVVILVRVLQENALPATALITQGSSLSIVLEKSLILDFLEKKYPKEVSIFKIHLGTSLCLYGKKVDLRAARHYIKKFIENTFGPIRDFNGGLIMKEEEQLKKIKAECKGQGIQLNLLEDLFYDIQPNYMRAFITSHTCTNLLHLLHKAMLTPIPADKPYYRAMFSSQQTEIVVIKIAPTSWLNEITAAIMASHHQIGYSHLNKGDFEYICFFAQFLIDYSLFETVEKCLHKFSKNGTASNTFVRLNLQGGNPSSLNPRFASDIHCHTLCSLLFEGLTRINHAGEPELALAKSIEVCSSGLEYIFALRASSWSNGEEVTAYDFERSWKKGLRESVPSFLCPRLFYYIKNARKVREKYLDLDLVGVRAEDANTLHVTLETPCHYFLHLIATPLFFPLHGDSEEPKHFNGPFYLEEWKHNRSMTLLRNPFYWNNKTVKVNGIKFQMETDVAQTYEKFLNKELEIIGDPLAPLTTDILKKEASNLYSQHVSRTFWIHCNRHVFPLQHKLIRQALNVALDRKKIASEVFYNQIPHSSPLPIGYAQKQLKLEGDPELANALFERALKELKIDKNAFPTLEFIHSNLAFEKDLVSELKKQWQEILGIHLVTKELTWCEFSSALEKGDFQLGGLFRRNLFNHPQYYLSFFQHSAMNPHSLDDANYERLFNQIEMNKDDAESIHQIEQFLIDEAPVFPLVSQVYFALVQEYVRGLSWSPNGCINLNKVFFENEEKINHRCINV